MSTDDNAQAPNDLDNLSVFEAFELLKGIKVDHLGDGCEGIRNPSKDHYKDVIYHLGERAMPEIDLSKFFKPWTWTVTSKAPPFMEEMFRRVGEAYERDRLKPGHGRFGLPITDTYYVDEEDSTVIRLL